MSTTESKNLVGPLVQRWSFWQSGFQLSSNGAGGILETEKGACL